MRITTRYVFRPESWVLSGDFLVMKKSEGLLFYFLDGQEDRILVLGTGDNPPVCRPSEAPVL
ncbi:MAG: hypothetical protein ACE5LV_09120 [Candidatus Aminicenantales bacterium]